MGLVSAIDIGLSGAFAATARLAASASNVANMQTNGSLLSAASAAPVSPVYPAVRVTLSAAAQAGVSVQVSQSQPSSIAAYDPTAPYANAQGMVATPNVDPVAEMADQADAMTQFSAAISTIRTADQMQKALLDIRV
jgi:flagellar basal-body rod protein FlgC